MNVNEYYFPRKQYLIVSISEYRRINRYLIWVINIFQTIDAMY